MGAAVTVGGGIAYIAYPIFLMYYDIGQPLYKYIIHGLLDRLVPNPAFTTDLPFSGRAILTHQSGQNRHILHLLYAAPQIRGKAIRNASGETRVMAMIEEVPAIGPVHIKVRLPKPACVYDAASGVVVNWTMGTDGQIAATVPRLHIHTALVFQRA